MPARDTGSERAVALARTALDRGMAALANHDIQTAIQWLDRARRLVPSDPNILLALASACLQREPARAEPLFAAVARDHDVRQAWLGLAAARSRMGDPRAAKEALAVALARHACMPDTERVADQIAPLGWCALRPDGELVIRPATGAAVSVTLDGQTIPGTHLPPDWDLGGMAEVRQDGAELLGSPIQIPSIRRLAGYVEISGAGLAGWAWYPNDPVTDPVLFLSDRNGRHRQIVLDQTPPTVPDIGPLARPRGFRITAEALRDWEDPIRVSGRDGRDLTGSPLHPSGSISVRPVGVGRRRRAVTVVIPVHNGGAVALACLASVVTSVPKDAAIVVVDDGSTDPAIVAALDDLASQRKIRMLRHDRALGFPASANAGMALAKGRDVVLLNSDTLVPPNWVERLRDAAYGAPDIGSVTPLSNDASIVSYPGPAGTNPVPDQAATNRLDRLAERANGAATVDIPVGVGFCLYLRRDCLDAAGGFRTDVFAQGYGEENDLCLRASRLGWRHVALTGLFVGHHGATTFGPAATHLRQRNGRLLEALHPGYDARIDQYLAADPIALPRRRIDILRWKQRARKWRQAAILIGHGDGGGVERRVRQAVAAHATQGRWPIVLRPAETSDKTSAIAVCDGTNDDVPNLIFAMPGELPLLARLLRESRADRIEAHHLANYSSAIYDLIARLALPYDVHVHDYALFCPRISLVSGHNRYCGEPDLPDCEACVADHGSLLKEEISVEALRHRSGIVLASARSVVVPAEDVGKRLGRYFPTPTTIIPHEDDGDRAWKPAAGARPRICVVGAIGIHKGYEILLACARDARRRGLDLDFVVVGHTIDDARLMATERVFVTGEFDSSEAVALIAAQDAALGFVPSIWPETWCLALGELWGAGLPAAAFDLGAPAERIKRSGRGFVLPLGLSPSAINNALLAAIEAAGH
jgi:GT2 family glycosyltransferase